MAEPNKEESITFDTLKRLLGAQQARSIFEQKRAAEIGIVYDEAAMVALEKIIDKGALPLDRDVRIAAPAMAAYFRGSFERTRRNVQEWIRHQRAQEANGAEPKSEPERLARLHHGRIVWDKSMTSERDAAFAQGMGFCPNHPPGERVKPQSEFGVDKKGPGGLSYRCRTCADAAQRLRRSRGFLGRARPQQSEPGRVLLKGSLMAEKKEALAMGLGYCPEHPSKEERFQPRENFYYSGGGAGHLSNRCKLHTHKNPEADWSKVRNPDAIRKAFTISHKATELKRDGLTHEEAVAQARLWYAEQRQPSAPNGSGGATADLPPVPQDADRPYEDTTPEPEPELIAAIAEEEHQ